MHLSTTSRVTTVRCARKPGLPGRFPSTLLGAQADERHQGQKARKRTSACPLEGTLPERKVTDIRTFLTFSFLASRGGDIPHRLPDIPCPPRAAAQATRRWTATGNTAAKPAEGRPPWGPGALLLPDKRDKTVFLLRFSITELKIYLSSFKATEQYVSYGNSHPATFPPGGSAQRHFGARGCGCPGHPAGPAAAQTLPPKPGGAPPPPAGLPTGASAQPRS